MTATEAKLLAAVIGVGPGLGASLARRFVAKVAVAINARTPDFLRTLANDIRERGGKALEIQADIQCGVSQTFHLDQGRQPTKSSNRWPDFVNESGR
jgi:NAD(P)-dependent dehydrogenase (short-subunit alcohol dehydrogenase family)